MQNDAVASMSLLHTASEEKKKQILLFLQRRQHFRNGLPPDTVTESLVPPPPQAQPTSQLSTATGNLPSKSQRVESHGKPTAATKAEANLPHTSEIPMDSSNPATVSTTQGQQPPPLVAFGLVVVCSNFRYLPPLADKTKDIANQLFHALTDSHFGRFSRRGSKLLINPSLIEFQDTMKELKAVCSSVGGDSSFFLCLASHGARVTSGVNEGSYVLFSETRLSSEEELLLTALHEHELAKMIHDIPCKNKLLALELCQVQQAKEKPADEAPSILNRVHDGITRRLFNELVTLELTTQQKTQPALTQAQLLSSKSSQFNTVILESCNIKSEAPVRSRTDNVSNFLHRLNDAFHGAAAKVPLDNIGPPATRAAFQVRDLCVYVKDAVNLDAKVQNEIVKTEYTKQLRTKYEQVAEFEDITHSPELLGFDRLADFTIGDIPAAPELAPSPPQFVSATTSSISLSWEPVFGGFHPTTSVEVPVILGYHIQIRGDGRACETWRRASGFQLLPFDDAFREKKIPRTEITVNGLPCDAAFRFRIRARTAGGWGPFSTKTKAYRTLSTTGVHDVFSTVEAVYTKNGVSGLRELMQVSQCNRDVLRCTVEFLARVALKGSTRARPGSHVTFPADLVVPIVQLVAKATDKFSEDASLTRGSSMLIGHLAQSNDSWRKSIISLRDPHRVDILLEQMVDRFAATDPETSAAAAWARMRLRGVSGRHRLSKDAAAKRIQGLYHTQKAREYMRSLASAVYTQMVDPSTGRSYIYNAKTAATSWSLPTFLGSRV